MQQALAFSNSIENTSALKKIGPFTCSMELGTRWTESTISSNLLLAQCNYETANQKLEFLAKNLLGTPFIYESHLPILSDGILRVRFASFDCVTFLYTLLALCGPLNFQQFVSKLYYLRYHSALGYVIKNNPLTGNIYDFVHESILTNAIQLGIVENITSSVARNQSLLPVTVDIKKFQRDYKFDPAGHSVSPKLYEGKVTCHFISTNQLAKSNLDYITSGDIAVLTLGERTKKGIENLALVNHLVVLIKEEGQLYFIHATINYALKSSEGKKHSTVSCGTRIYYDQEHQKEQIGVGYGGEYAGDQYRISGDGINYYGYYQDKKRSFIDYAQENFCGVIFLRPLLKT